ncbi:hypothetical protein EUX53_23275 [Pseudomonas orientalis]|nr:hypothetical protein EUX53_23275 [Pseudomonas orientalis]
MQRNHLDHGPVPRIREDQRGISHLKAGASLLEKNSTPPRSSRVYALWLTFFASKLAPTRVTTRGSSGGETSACSSSGDPRCRWQDPAGTPRRYSTSRRPLGVSRR